MKGFPLGLADLARALEILGSLDEEMVRMMGLDPVISTKDPVFDPSTPLLQPQSTLTPMEREKPETRLDPRPDTKPAAFTLSMQQLVSRSPQSFDAFLKIPPWISKGTSKKASPLYPKHQLRGFLSDCLARPFRQKGYSLQQVIDTLASGKPLDGDHYTTVMRMPTQVQLLIDRCDSMEPFMGELHLLESTLKSLYGPALTLFYCQLHPWERLRSKPKGAPLGIPGSTILVVSDFGIGRPIWGDYLLSFKPWRLFAERVASLGASAHALIPYSQQRWPKELTRFFTSFAWFANPSHSGHGSVQSEVADLKGPPVSDGYWAHRPWAWRLAILSSLANFVDTGWLRLLRTTFFPNHPPDLEADIWLSPDIGRKTTGQFFIFEDVFLAGLRCHLDKSTLLDQVWNLLLAYRWSPKINEPLLVEERLRYLKLSDPQGFEEEAPNLLHWLLKLGEETGKSNIIRWCSHSLPLLEEVLKDQPLARAIQMGARFQLGNRSLGTWQPDIESAGNLHLPKDYPFVSVSVSIQESSLVLAELQNVSDTSSLCHIEVPDTSPRVVFIEETKECLKFFPGKSISKVVMETELTLVTLAGHQYKLQLHRIQQSISPLHLSDFHVGKESQYQAFDEGIPQMWEGREAEVLLIKPEPSIAPKPESIRSLEKELDIEFIEDPPEIFWESCWERNGSNDAWASFTLNPETLQVVGLGFRGLLFKTVILKKFKHLQFLWARICGLQQIADLEHLAQISHLHLGGNNVKDLFPLAQLTRLTRLELDGNQIQDLSPLAQLTSLTQLVLENNQIQDLSPLAQLTSLTFLSLARDQIQDLSPLAQLTSLTRLELDGNQIQDLSPLAQLTSLSHLVLENNQFQNLSPLAQLTSLTFLNLARGQIQDLSPLTPLTGLTQLYLMTNQIQDLSPLAQLTSLTRLELDGNQVQDLSPLVQLTSLTHLVLENNQIQDLSPLAQLTSLTFLNLARDQIQDLSPLAPLTGLTQLYLMNNQIQDVSPLAKLTSLTRLELDANQIQDVSPLLPLYQKGIYISLDHNPMEQPPLEICSHGDEAILAWFEAPGQRRRLNEVKVLLVGAGAAGKTSLTRALLGEPFNEEETKTDGIRISSWHCPFQDQVVRVRLWDFGGQEIMHATHQFFMSHRCLYLLVLDGRKEEGLVDYWFKLIQNFGGESPILVVLNKVEQHPNYDLNQAALREKYPAIIGFFQVSAKSQRGLDELKTQIQNALHKGKLVSSVWPEPWLQVKEYLQQSDKDFLDLETFYEICRQHQVTVDSHQKTLLTYLSDLGIALHFEDIALHNTQVLNPAWITEPVYQLINHPALAKTQGLLMIDQLRDLLPTFPVTQLNFLLELMCKFEICYPLAEKRLIFPDLLPVSQPDLPGLGAHPLRLRIVYDFLPRSILARLMVQLYRFIKDRLQWRAGMLLEHKEMKSQAIIRVDYEQRGLTLQTAGADPKKFFNIILGHLREIHRSFRDIGCRELVACNCSQCLKSERPFEIDYQNLIQFHEKKKPFFTCMHSTEDVPVAKLLGETYLEPPADWTEWRAELEEYRPSFSKKAAFVGFALKWAIKNLGDRPTTSGHLDKLIETIWKRGLAANPEVTPPDSTSRIKETKRPKEPKATNQLCWLHLSDLHHNPKNAWDSERVLRLLREDAASVFKEQQLRPQLLFATGDLGYGEGSSNLSLCDQIKATLKVLEEVAEQFGIARENIFMVPGNHDVNRKKIERSDRSLCKDLLADPEANRIIGEMMAQDGRDWRGLQSRLQDYLEAVSHHNKHLYRDHGAQAVYHQIRSFEGVPVGIFGFNGVWSCGSEDKPGNLLLGAKWQLNLAEEHLTQTQLNFGLIHHPPNWYTKSERDQLQKRLDQTFNFLLHGHEHEDWVHTTGQEGNTLVRVAAGASYTPNTQELGYNIGSLNLKTGEGKIHLRAYSEENWIPKIIKNRADTGAWPFQIPIKPKKE